jgi:DnaJ-class molecular chaperone
MQSKDNGGSGGRRRNKTSVDPMDDAIDYYALLGIPKDATEEQIKRAYRKLAFKYHPDRNPEAQKEEFAEKFAKLTDAYETLIDVHKRELYDKFGIQGLKQHYQQQEFGDAAFYTDSQLFAQLFGNSFFSTVFGGSDLNESQRFHTRKEDVFIPIEVTLEELFTGTVRPYTISRTTICAACNGTGAKSPEHIFFCKACKGTGDRTMRRTLPRGVQLFQTKCSDCEGRGQFITEKCPVCKGRTILTQKKTVHIQIYPGMRHKHKIVLKGMGDEWPGKITADLIFVLHQLEHSVFTRRGDDLYILKSISLLDALTGFELILETLEPNKKLHISVDEVIHPGMAKAILNEGMPIFNPNDTTGKSNPDMKYRARGALVVLFEVIFPHHLNIEMKSYLRLLMDPKSHNKNALPAIESLKKQTEKWKIEILSRKEQEEQKPNVSTGNGALEVREVKFEPGHYDIGIDFKQPYRGTTSPDNKQEREEPVAKIHRNKRHGGFLSSVCAQQ